LTSRNLLPAGTPVPSARPNTLFGNTTFTLSDSGYDDIFRRRHDAYASECFSVYASIHLSPPELQDSIHGRADYSFRDEDFHLARCAPLRLAHRGRGYQVSRLTDYTTSMIMSVRSNAKTYTYSFRERLVPHHEPRGWPQGVLGSNAFRHYVSALGFRHVAPKREESCSLAIERIADIVGRRYQLASHDIRNSAPGKANPARLIAMHVCDKLSGADRTEIAAYFRVSPTTLPVTLSRFRAKVKVEKHTASLLLAIENALRSGNAGSDRNLLT
jgi:hypothetical protein